MVNSCNVSGFRVLLNHVSVFYTCFVYKGINGPVCDIELIRGRHNSATYIRILQRTMCPLFRRDPNLVFIQDNSSIHTSHATGAFLARQPFKIMFLPAYSPDINLIEHVWAYIVQRWEDVEVRNGLDNAVRNAWRNLYNHPGKIKRNKLAHNSTIT